MSSYVNCLGGRCPHMPFFIGGHMSGGENVLHSYQRANKAHQYKRVNLFAYLFIGARPRLNLLLLSYCM